MFQYKKLTTEEKIKRMKIELQEEQPFWARLILNMLISEDTNKSLPEYGGMGINAKGDMLYKKDFVDKLTDSELKFVLAHEVAHVMFCHLLRRGNRTALGWNIAADLVVNEILHCNDFTPLASGLIPEHDHSFKFDGFTIEHINEKTAEQIYDELPEDKKTNEGRGKQGEGENHEGQFDYHDCSAQMSEQEKKETTQKWNDQIIDAVAYAKHKGHMPAGLDRYIKDILEPQVGWKHLIYKWVTNTLPYDFSYSRPSKKSISTGYYMPSVYKETLELVAHIDTSGSIAPDELVAFNSEIVSIARSFANVKITLIECDCAIQQVLEVANGNIHEITEMKVKGGGGTSHKPVFDYIEENIPHCKLLISLTDGHSDIESITPPGYGVIFVISKNGVKEEFDFGKTIFLEE